MRANNKFNYLAGTIVSLIISFKGFSQNENSWLSNMNKEDSAAINALVLYPDSIRLSIFEACKYPEAIVRIAALQKSTSQDFEDLISSYPQKEQEDFWNVTRYPGLIDRLVAGGKKSSEQINSILKDYPNEIHETALALGSNNYEVLKQIQQLNSQSEQAFETLLKNYSAPAADAFHNLIDLPEVLSILNEHMQMTVLVGDMYRRNPQWVVHTADSLNLVIAKQNAEDVAAWKQMLDENPKAKADLQKAAEDYEQDNCGDNEEECLHPVQTDYVQYYVSYPFPYWFGYPYWYPYNYWYPYPYWYDWGFYYDQWGSMIFIGLPSWYFTYWYFYYPNHYYYYPYFCDAYVNYYYGPRDVASDNANTVRDWVDDNREYLQGDFASNSTGRVEAIKQLGQLGMDYQQAKAKGTTMTQQEFINKNYNKYPALNKPSAQKPPGQTQSYVQQQKFPPVKLPAVKVSPGTSGQKPPRTKYDFNKVNPAQQHHRSTWDQGHPPAQSSPRQSNPSPRQGVPMQQIPRK